MSSTGPDCRSFSCVSVPGPVQLALFQPLPLPDSLAHCLKYSLAVTVHPAHLKYGTGCMDQPQLPAALAEVVNPKTRTKEATLFWDWRELTVPEGEETLEEVEVGWVEGDSVLHVVWEEHVAGLAVELAPAAGKMVQVCRPALSHCSGSSVSLPPALSHRAGASVCGAAHVGGTCNIPHACTLCRSWVYSAELSVSAGP